MLYFTEKNYELLCNEEEHEVYFDDNDGNKLNNRTYIHEKKIYDEDGEVYLNMDEVSDDMEDHIAYALEGMDPLTQIELRESGCLSSYFSQFVDDVREDYRNSAIYPFVSEEDFLSSLSSRIEEKVMGTQDVDWESEGDSYDEDFYEED